MSNVDQAYKMMDDNDEILLIVARAVYEVIIYNLRIQFILICHELKFYRHEKSSGFHSG